VTELNFFRRGGAYVFPLYLYPEEGTLDETVRLNFDHKLYAAVCKAAGIDPADQAGPDGDFRAATREARPSEAKVFDYIYGVLHAPAYRKTFAEFLKIDFPRVPYPPSPEVFRHVSEKGEQLRRLHLMEPAAIGDAPYVFKGDGDGVVDIGNIGAQDVLGKCRAQGCRGQSEHDIRALMSRPRGVAHRPYRHQRSHRMAPFAATFANIRDGKRPSRSESVTSVLSAHAAGWPALAVSSAKLAFAAQRFRLASAARSMSHSGQVPVNQS
jgi:hypothetical protein